MMNEGQEVTETCVQSQSYQGISTWDARLSAIVGRSDGLSILLPHIISRRRGPCTIVDTLFGCPPFRAGGASPFITGGTTPSPSFPFLPVISLPFPISF